NAQRVRPASEAQAFLPCEHALYPTSFIGPFGVQRRERLRQAPKSLILTYAFVYQKTLQGLAAARRKEDQALVNPVENRVAHLRGAAFSPSRFDIGLTHRFQQRELLRFTLAFRWSCTFMFSKEVISTLSHGHKPSLVSPDFNEATKVF